MSEPKPSTGFIVKLLYDNFTLKPRWVRVGQGKGIGPRENATVFPNQAAADAEAEIWKAPGLSVVVELAD